MWSVMHIREVQISFHYCSATEDIAKQKWKHSFKHTHLLTFDRRMISTKGSNYLCRSCMRHYWKGGNWQKSETAGSVKCTYICTYSQRHGSHPTQKHKVHCILTVWQQLYFLLIISIQSNSLTLKAFIYMFKYGMSGLVLNIICTFVIQVLLTDSGVCHIMNTEHVNHL